MWIIIVYLSLINIAAFIAMGADKRRARKGRWRISKKTLFLFGAFGGSVGGILGMQVFRHKTKHKLFTLGFPAILVLQCAAALLWVYNFG